jgi:adenylate cyclase
VNRRYRIARRLLSAVVIAALAAALTAFGVSHGEFRHLQSLATDNFFPSAKTDPHVVVVGFDEKSIQDHRINLPPWPRSIEAALARHLTAGGAKVIVWDIAFYAPGTDDAQTADLANALREAKDAGVTTILGVDGKFHGSADGLRVLQPALPATPVLAAQQGSEGHVKVDTSDGDGVVREVPIVVETSTGKFLPSLSLAAVLAYRGAAPQPTVSPKGVQAGGRFVPTEGDALLRLNWARGLDASVGSKSNLSALDVLEGKYDGTNRFNGKIVLIGATAESARDNFDVPIDKSGGMPGVFIHANAINTMLTASYLHLGGHTATVLTVALLTLLVALAVLFLPLWLSVVATFLLGAAYLVYTALKFNSGHILNLVYAFGMMVIAFIAAVMVRYFTETRQRQRVSRLFAQYVPETVAQQLVEEGRIDQAVEGERLDVSLFFCDLRGFTAMSAKLTPQQVRVMLNEFYDALTEIILERKGTVLKFVGDEVFAVFGAPLPVAHHPDVALECAMAIQRAAPDLSEKLAEMDIPAVHFGIGMNTGEVVAAHVGGGRRRQYDIVGDTVNIGSRMCGQAGKGDIVMPIDMYRTLENPPPAESMGFVALKNVEQPMELMRIRVDAPLEEEAPEPTSATMGV